MTDTLELNVPDTVVLKTPTQWLVNQAFELLNTEGAAAERSYGQVTELLRCRDDAVKTLFAVSRSVPAEDVGIRWCALYVVGDVGDLSSAEPLFRVASEPLPEHHQKNEGCEGPRDGEILVRTMAIESLRRVAERHEEAGEMVLKLIGERPDRALMVEAVKAACALQLTDKARELLREEDRWMLDLKVVPVSEVMAEPERDDATALGYVPPNQRSEIERPATDCCVPRRED